MKMYSEINKGMRLYIETFGDYKTLPYSYTASQYELYKYIKEKKTHLDFVFLLRGPGIQNMKHKVLVSATQYDMNILL